MNSRSEEREKFSRYMEMILWQIRVLNIQVESMVEDTKQRVEETRKLIDKLKTDGQSFDSRHGINRGNSQSNQPL